MPSFDIVSEVDMHEVANAIDQANREIDNRFDFKGANAKFEQTKEKISLKAADDFHLKQMLDILTLKLAKRQVDVKSMDIATPEIALNEARQTVTIKQGIDQETAKKISKIVKDSKIKVQASIQGDKVRVSGKNRDDLQEAIGFLKKQNLELPLQFDNFRD